MRREGAEKVLGKMKEVEKQATQEKE